MTARSRAYLSLMSSTAGRGAVAGLLSLQVVVALMEGLGLTLLVPVMQSLGGDDELRLPGTDATLTLPVAFALVLLVVVVRSLAQWRVAVVSVQIRLATVDALRLRLFDGLLAAEWTYVAGQRRSHVVQRLTTEVERAQTALVMLLRILVAVPILAATVGVAVLLSPLIGGLAAVGLLLATAATRRSVRSATRLGQEMSRGVADLGAAVTDSLASVRLTRAHDAGRAWTDLVEAEASRVRGIRTSFVRRTSAVVAGLAVGVVFAVMVLVVVGRQAGLPFAELAVLVVVASRILATAQGLLGAVQVFANEAPALDQLSDFEREIEQHRQTGSVPGRPQEPAGPQEPLVALRGVTVRYATDGPTVLDDVDLQVPHRGLVTVWGPSGGGKSTLLDVVLGLVPPETGQVLVDGSPLVDLSSWRARVGYVPQQTVLVPGTVRQNLTWSLQPGREVADEDLWAALRTACVDTVVESLPAGLDTPLREIAGLSGGEQQRLCIARALVRDPELLVLDEATSALDTGTEERVLGQLLDGSRAVLLVTHRPAERARADVVAHLADGMLTVGPDTGRS
ncbi:ABC transporter, ATP-binding protein [Aeromicrobium marinum DSM 15272]|uniref:ABC transporter, ATP-binding protein n=2 Tax=Aeromicrobium marinum TaxID=219314 RepID=E2SEX5_9ACTN|nr:ABC transporter, ATP-binding protein [Aeromicrobium marinum DSM 15272]